MNSDVNFTIRPIELLGRAGWPFKKRGKWIDLIRCPVCDGGNNGDKHTFGVHEEIGNFICLRSSCGVSGNFWKLIEMAGMDPRDHIGGYERKKKKRGFVYGK